DNLYIQAVAPGANPETLDISVEGDVLTIAGEKLASNAGEGAEPIRDRERVAGPFSRTITLPAPVADEAASAEYRDGILRVTLPKREEAKPRRIPVNAAA